MTEAPDPLARLGWDEHAASAWAAHRGDGNLPGRVAAEHRGGYIVLAAAGELRGDLAGKLRKAAAKDAMLKPAVGDWVALDVHAAAGTATIHAVLPRKTVLTRRAAGRAAAPQIVAADVDAVFIVHPLDQPPNLRRLERYLAITLASGAAPVLALTKADLVESAEPVLSAIRPLLDKVAGGRAVPVHVLSSVSGQGLDELDAYVARPQTTALIGASGVGKSTLINRWLGEERLSTGSLRDDGKGRHTTTHRELLVLPRGGLVIDTPGMRELGLWNADESVPEAFADIAAVAEGCRFRDCTHAHEPGCAVQAAAASGVIELERLDSYRKLVAELASLTRDRETAARNRARRADHRSLRAYYKDPRTRGQRD
ncbi:ribosome small subunit-dependent GTPase A [Nannocystis radixulma]|uniref:Small ribosomal subunit biogenesis GTPase RsgA n=1 Tax=Nannocystis radixulma TaxID=2995305 RepID=A0ABT5BMJ0_9BACT|nr:ribosome small subunit-dependent GTPase A [Nannocystis radixulma]MDC0674618.1 ribosome small subunit-dependent GTPase A [Nannocystis radixulma]